MKQFIIQVYYGRIYIATIKIPIKYIINPYSDISNLLSTIVVDNNTVIYTGVQ